VAIVLHGRKPENWDRCPAKRIENRFKQECHKRRYRLDFRRFERPERTNKALELQDFLKIIGEIFSKTSKAIEKYVTLPLKV